MAGGGEEEEGSRTIAETSLKESRGQSLARP